MKKTDSDGQDLCDLDRLIEERAPLGQQKREARRVAKQQQVAETA